jgi:hypothetical protein
MNTSFGDVVIADIFADLTGRLFRFLCITCFHITASVMLIHNNEGNLFGSILWWRFT